MKKIVCALMILIMPLTNVFADSVASGEIVAEKIISLGKGRSAKLVTRKMETSAMGRPFLVELQVQCSESASWEKQPVRDQEAVCDVKTSSAKLNSAGTHISVMIRETNAQAFNEQSRKVSAEQLAHLKPQCQKKAQEFLFSLEGLCP